MKYIKITLACLSILTLLLLSACGGNNSSNKSASTAPSTSEQQQGQNSTIPTVPPPPDDATQAHDAAQAWCDDIHQAKYQEALDSQTSSSQFTTQYPSKLEHWEETTFYGPAANDGSAKNPSVTGCTVSQPLIQSGTYAGQDYVIADVHITWQFDGQPDVDQVVRLKKEGGIWKVDLIVAGAGF